MVKVEKMSASDLEQIIGLADQLGYPNSLEDVRDRFRNIENCPTHGLFVAKTDGGKIVGYIQINFEPETLLAGPRADIAALVVDETQRSQGVGTALLKHAELWAKEKGLSHVRIRSNMKRKDAHRFYEKNGYAINKSSQIFVRTIT